MREIDIIRRNAAEVAKVRPCFVYSLAYSWIAVGELYFEGHQANDIIEQAQALYKRKRFITLDEAVAHIVHPWLECE